MISYDITRPCRNPRFRSWSPRFKVDCSRDIVADNKRQQILYQKRMHSLRRVPGFTIQAEQKCTKPFTPANAMSRRQVNKYEEENEQKFVKFYEDRQLPIRVVNSTSLRRNVEWLVNPAELTVTESRDLLRKISYGLSTTKQPYSMIALRTFQDLISLNDAPVILAQTLTDTIPNIRRGLGSSSIVKRMEMLDLLQRMANMEGIGPLLVPFYRILLPPLRRGVPNQISDDITATKRDQYNEAVSNTLGDLERTGGRHAYINIKYLLPDYQSSIIY